MYRFDLMVVPGLRRVMGITPSASQKTVAMTSPAQAWGFEIFFYMNFCDDIPWTDLVSAS